MRALMSFFSTVALLTCLGFSTSAIAERAPWLSTTPNPPPADQDFPAVLHIMVNPMTQGFWGEQYPEKVVNGNVITYSFDTGCGFLCGGGEPTYKAFPFTMPALPAGTYIVRFALDPNETSNFLAEFTIDVGLGGSTSTDLPIGGSASALLGLLILLLGWQHLRARGRDVDRVA